MRGEVLVRQNTPSNTVYVVVSGRFEVWIEGRENPVSEIGIGEPISEIGFFSGEPRAATIIAARDSMVPELDRPSFDDVARRVPAVYQTVLRALARRLANTSTRLPSVKRVVAASSRSARLLTLVPRNIFQETSARFLTGQLGCGFG